MEETVTTTIATTLSDIGTVITSAFTWAGSAIDFITNNPLCLVFAVIPLVGLGIGLLKRVLN